MSGLRKIQLCARCKPTDGWLYDESGDEAIVTPCPCRSTATPEAERDAALAGTADSNPQAMKAALRIIRDTALSMPTFSSNDTRAAMVIAQIPKAVIGTAFQQAAKDRVIRRCGYVTSTDAGTHAHPVAQWESRIYRAGIPMRGETA